MAARWITWLQPRMARRACSSVAEVTGVHLAAFAHPYGRCSLVRDAYLEVRVAEQASDNRRADQPGATGDQDTRHARSAATSLA